MPDKSPIAWIDSEALSTTTDLQPYLPMLRAMVRMYRAYLPEAEEAEVIAALIDDLDDASWARLVDNIPAEITDRDPAGFGDWAGVPADDLRKAAGL